MHNGQHDDGDEDSVLSRKEHEKKVWIALTIYVLGCFPVFWIWQHTGAFGDLFVAVYSIAGFIGIGKWVGVI